MIVKPEGAFDWQNDARRAAGEELILEGRGLVLCPVGQRVTGQNLGDRQVVVGEGLAVGEGAVPVFVDDKLFLVSVEPGNQIVGLIALGADAVEQLAPLVLTSTLISLPIL